MIWVGGAPGAGKTTIARLLAHRHDLPLHPIDLWTYDHVARLGPLRPLEDDLALGPELAADAFEAIAVARLPLVLMDVRQRGLGDVPALVEGPLLLPSLAGQAGVRRSVWLVPDPQRTRLAREERLAAAVDPRGQARLRALLQRDAVLAERICSSAAGLDLPVVAVPTDVDWAVVESAVVAAIRLGETARLPAGPELIRQRRFENQVACRQGRAWQRDIGLEVLPPYPFACECGSSGCDGVWSSTPDDYDARALRGNVTADGH